MTEYSKHVKMKHELGITAGAISVVPLPSQIGRVNLPRTCEHVAYLRRKQLVN